MTNKWATIIAFNQSQPASTMKLMSIMWDAALSKPWNESMVSNLLSYPLDSMGVAEQLDSAGVKVPPEIARNFLI
jgi:hypothetical protein